MTLHEIKRICMSSTLYTVIVFVALILPSPMNARDFIHIFTSKGAYETCEDLWFKCLVMNDSTFSLSDKYHTAFVEILNSADSVVWKEKYPVIKGECDGQIYVGDDWESGEYRMYVNTAGSVGKRDTLLTPKRLLIVKELPDVQNFASRYNGITYRSADSIVYGGIKPLNITIELDSAEYHTRSKVRAKIRVTNSDGTPVQARVALSVSDRLYRYALGEQDLLSHCIAVQEQHAGNPESFFEPILPDGAVSGFLKSRKKKGNPNLENQAINVFDFSNKTGNLNLILTDAAGHFEVPADVVSSLEWFILLKPLSAKEFKGELEIDAPFEMLKGIHSNSKDVSYPLIQFQKDEMEEKDSVDYNGRRIVRLDEVVVNGHAGRYPKRNKLLGYLDSISTLHGGAWTCGCHAGHNTTFLNDYIPGYTHHPNGSGQPRKRGVPVKGKDYELIKYSSETVQGTEIGHVEDIRHVIYSGPKYSEEELLRMNGLWKTKGYYPHHDFTIVGEEELSLGLDDNRNTLLWLPGVTTNSNGEYEFEFFTSDIISSFEIRCIGYGGPSKFGEVKSVLRVLKETESLQY